MHVNRNIPDVLWAAYEAGAVSLQVSFTVLARLPLCFLRGFLTRALINKTFRIPASPSVSTEARNVWNKAFRRPSAFLFCVNYSTSGGRAGLKDAGSVAFVSAWRSERWNRNDGSQLGSASLFHTLLLGRVCAFFKKTQKFFLSSKLLFFWGSIREPKPHLSGFVL